MQSHITHIRRVCVQLYPATCPFVRMTGIFYRLLQSHRGETDTRIRFRTDSWPWGRKILPPFQPGLEPATFWSWVWCLTTELSLIPLGRTRSDAFSRVTCLCWLSAQYLMGCILRQWQRPKFQQIELCSCTHVQKKIVQNPNPATISRGEKQSKTMMTCVAQQSSFSYNFGLFFRYSAMSGQMHVASKK